MRGLSPDSLLAIADEVCETHAVVVRDFAALAAAAATSTASFHGVRVFGSSEAMAEKVSEIIRVLKPLSGRNETFAAVTQRVLLEINK
ncbi:TetR family transcriptional regulator [Corynebacterium crudilactis]|uniref:TetR family transcriptional regulator n=1 Tax=Corynebacterium crudilactis TaxID=1652495 RepID=A0A172QQ19_9CORY|nr:TetR family transcriptional regulator [Corynebacterium crudilactis]ANE02786.1 TetR family transcriptional regulator [Corynebacterium crudilactis]